MVKMQQVLVNIENKELERRLVEEANKKGRQLSKIILEVLENNFLPKRKPKRRYKKLDPLKYMSKIDYDFDDTTDDDLADVVPFEDIKDSAAYVSELRKNAWRK